VACLSDDRVTGGDTHIDNSNVLHKDRHYGKGGRRNWKQRFFVLYSDGELAYFSSADGNPGQDGGAEPKGRVQLVSQGNFAMWHVRDNADEFVRLFSLYSNPRREHFSGFMRDATARCTRTLTD